MLILLLLTSCNPKMVPSPTVAQVPIPSLTTTSIPIPTEPGGIPVSITGPSGNGYHVAYWEDGLYLTTTNGSEPVLLESEEISGLNFQGREGYKPWVWSPDGYKIAYNLLDEQKTIILDLKNGLRFEYKLFEPVSADYSYLVYLEWHPDGQTLVGLTVDELYFLDSTTGEQSATLSIPPEYSHNIFSTARMSPDGQSIAFLGDWTSGNLYIHSLILDDQGHPQAIGELEKVVEFGVPFGDFEWLPGGKKIVLSSFYDDTDHLFVFNTDGTGKVELFNRLGFVISQKLQKWAISPDGSQIAFRVMDYNDQAKNKVYAINTDGTGLTEITDPAYPVGYAPDWAPDDQTLLFRIGGSGLGAVILCNSDGTQKSILPISPDAKFVLFRPLAVVMKTTVAPTPATNNRTRITPENAAALTVLNTLLGHSADVDSIAFSPDGTLLASSAYNDPIRLWDTATGLIARLLTGHADGASSLAFSPDGTQLASGGFDGTVKLWDPATGKLVSNLRGHTDAVLAVAFSPDGTQLASTGFDSTVHLWDPRNGLLVSILEIQNSGYEIEFSPDGKYLVAAGASLQIWDTSHYNTGSSKPEFTGMSVAFSPSSNLVASEGINGILLWKPSTGAQVGFLPGTNNSGTPLEIVFSPDGKLVASISDSGLVQLWNVVGGNLLITYPGGMPPFSHVGIAFSPDGTTLGFSCGKGDICLWGIP
jgi:WD40 repeat protein